MTQVCKMAITFILFMLLRIPGLHADIMVGTIFFNPPFVFNTQQGFDIDLIHAICQRLNTPCTLIPMQYNALFDALNNGTVDIIIGGLNDAEIQQDKYIFSLPYLISRGQFLTLSKYDYKVIQDLQGKDVGVFKGSDAGSIYYRYLETNYSNFFRILPYDNPESLIADFSNGEFAATFIHEASALYWIQNSSGTIKLLGEPVNLGAGVAIVAMPRNLPLIQKINAALQELEQNGTYLRLYRTYLYYAR